MNMMSHLHPQNCSSFHAPWYHVWKWLHTSHSSPHSCHPTAQEQHLVHYYEGMLNYMTIQIILLTWHPFSPHPRSNLFLISILHWCNNKIFSPCLWSQSRRWCVHYFDDQIRLIWFVAEKNCECPSDQPRSPNIQRRRGMQRKTTR